ncbi:hypothetical protein GP935_26660 [Escherichia coli]|uniref:hypothetical protein n=1 Tax=Escherichia coli TaxID=562 RepID=UPI000FBA3B32|nr:hypothetical protein [Escherichia coli]EEY5897904.1 hypothetical protein [Escherichia coli]EFC5414102.1 hypothetical protein [Escherichia coli]EFD5109304.1 hypothetical protein [Escherichia coli]EFD8929842.1 hypothetical protein [Escherichia coli]EFF0247461.1 hypothetical protein [Escherichia coli]
MRIPSYKEPGEGHVIQALRQAYADNPRILPGDLCAKFDVSVSTMKRWLAMPENDVQALVNEEVRDMATVDEVIEHFCPNGRDIPDTQRRWRLYQIMRALEDKGWNRIKITRYLGLNRGTARYYLSMSEDEVQRIRDIAEGRLIINVRRTKKPLKKSELLEIIDAQNKLPTITRPQICEVTGLSMSRLMRYLALSPADREALLTGNK